MQIEFSTKFKKAYKKRIQPNEVLQKRFWEKLALFQIDPFDRSLKTHKLIGELSALYAFSVDYDCRVVFEFLPNGDVTLLNIGTHRQVY